MEYQLPVPINIDPPLASHRVQRTQGLSHLFLGGKQTLLR